MLTRTIQLTSAIIHFHKAKKVSEREWMQDYFFWNETIFLHLSSEEMLLVLEATWKMMDLTDSTEINVLSVKLTTWRDQ